MLKVGDKAPDFKLKDGKGNNVSLKDYKGKSVVLYFYPKDSTPGCTKEACDFQSQQAVLRKKGAVVFGVSADSVESHAKFAEKYDLKLPLLSDPDKSAIKSYGVWQEKNMYGQKKMGIVRTTYVIDEKGKIKNIYGKVKVDGHVDNVLSDL